MASSDTLGPEILAQRIVDLLRNHARRGTPTIDDVFGTAPRNSRSPHPGSRDSPGAERPRFLNTEDRDAFLKFFGGALHFAASRDPTPSLRQRV